MSNDNNEKGAGFSSAEMDEWLTKQELPPLKRSQRNAQPQEITQPVTVIRSDDDEVRESEARYEMEEIRARKGLEYLDDDPDAALDPEFVLLRDFSRMHQRTPDDAAAHDYYGELFMRARLHSDAVAAYERVVQLKPRDGRARYNYAAALEADMIVKFSSTFNAGSVETLEQVFAQYEAACQLDPLLNEAQRKRHEIGSHLMNVRKMVQIYGIEGTRAMLRQEKAQQPEEGLWRKLKGFFRNN